MILPEAGWSLVHFLVAQSMHANGLLALDDWFCVWSLIRGNVLECPQGTPELCAPGRKGLACNNCLPKYYPTGSGDCKPCEGHDTIGFYIGMLLLWCAAAILLRVMNIDMNQSSLSKLTIVAVGNQLVMVIQTFSTISKLRIAWPEPVKSLIELADLIMTLGCCCCLFCLFSVTL